MESKCIRHQKAVYQTYRADLIVLKSTAHLFSHVCGILV